MPEWAKNQTTAEQNNGCYDKAMSATQLQWTVYNRIEHKMEIDLYLCWTKRLQEHQALKLNCVGVSQSVYSSEYKNLYRLWFLDTKKYNVYFKFQHLQKRRSKNLTI